MSDPVTDTRRPARWMRPALVVSLALNLLILGAIGGALLLHGPGPGHHRHGGFAGGPITRALSDEDRRAIGRQMRRAYAEGTLPGRGGRADFDALLAAIRAQPFDRDALARAMAARRAAMQAHLDLGQRLLLDRLSDMSDAERADFAARLAAQRQRRH